MDLRNILLDYYNNKKSLDEVIKSISVFSVEYIENDVAQTGSSKIVANRESTLSTANNDHVKCFHFDLL